MKECLNDKNLCLFFHDVKFPMARMPVVNLAVIKMMQQNVNMIVHTLHTLAGVGLVLLLR